MRRFIAAAASAAALLCSLSSPAVAATPRLYIATNGVALSSFPSGSRLQASVTVGVTQPGAKAQWAAKSNAAWLTVTPSGNTGKTLQLQADPSALAADQVYTALVDVHTKSGAEFQDKETIRVSFWKGSSDPQPVSLTRTTASLAANPVEPWVYVSDGGASIGVYNVYSGTLVKTFPKVAPSIGHLSTSSDGRSLFVADLTNYRIVQVDAGNGKTIRRIALQGPLPRDFSFAYARPSGAETLFAVGQPAIDVATGQAISPVLSLPYGSSDPFIVATPDGGRLAVLDRTYSNELYTWTVAPDDSGQLAFTPILSGKMLNGYGCSVLAWSPDGTRLYPACSSPSEFDAYDWATGTQVQTLPAGAYPDNAAFDSNGDFVGGLGGSYLDFDVYVYNAKGYLLGKVASNYQYYGQVTGLLVTSGDSSRVISALSPDYNGNQTLLFRSLP